MDKHEILHALVQDLSNFSDILQAIATQERRPEISYCAGIALMIRKNAIDYFLRLEEEKTLQTLPSTFILKQYSMSKDTFLRDLSLRARQFSEHMSKIQMDVSKLNQNKNSLFGMTDAVRFGFINSDWELLVSILEKYFK